MKELPPPSTSRATVTSWQPGRMTVTLDPAPPQPSYLVVAENWYPDWQVAIDGQRGQLLRGDYSLITVPLPTGARTVDLTFHSRSFEIGKAITLASLALLLITLVASLAGPRARPASRGAGRHPHVQRGGQPRSACGAGAGAGCPSPDPRGR